MRRIMTIGVIGIAISASAMAQTGPTPTPNAPTSPAVGDSATSPGAPAPMGHRQPTARNVPQTNGSGSPAIAPIDRQLDQIKICRNC